MDILNHTSVVSSMLFIERANELCIIAICTENQMLSAPYIHTIGRLFCQFKVIYGHYGIDPYPFGGVLISDKVKK